MASTVQWPTFKDSDTPLQQLAALSRYYGSDVDFIIAGGGNTSVKVNDRLFVKGSGTSLATITPEGFVEMDRKALEALVNSELSTERAQREEQFKQAVMAARVAPGKHQRPSVEAVLHHLMPRKFVVHSHATLVNMYTCCQNGQAILTDLLGDAIVWIGEVDPGFALARTLKDALKQYARRTGRDCPRAVIMQNHGVAVCGDTPEEVKAHTDWLLGQLKSRLEKAPGDCSFGPVSRVEAGTTQGLINTIAPMLRGLLATGESLKVVTFDESPVVLSLTSSEAGKDIAMGGPLSPGPDRLLQSRPDVVRAQDRRSPGRDPGPSASGDPGTRSTQALSALRRPGQGPGPVRVGR